MNKSRTLLTLIAVAAALTGCGSDDQAGPANVAALSDDDGVLAYVPADTPYVFATPEPMPEDVLGKLEANADSIYGAYEIVIKETLKGLEEERDGGNSEDADSVITLIGELAGMMRSDELRAAGVPRSPQMAIYGVGMLPVLRLQLADTDAFEAKIADITESSDVEMRSGEVAGEAYQYAGDEDARLVIATIDDYGVAAMVPTALSDEQLELVLGIEQPSESIAESGALEQLAESYGYGPHALGFLDIERFAAIFVDASSGLNAELLGMMDYDPSELSDVCRTEIREVSQIVPRIVSGYTTISTETLNSNSVLEIREDLAKSLMGLSSPVPGMGIDHGGLGSFGMSMDLLALREFYEARLDALEADPFECEYFAELQAGLGQGRAALNQPLPPIVYGFKGFVAVVDNLDGFDMASQQPPTDVDARLLVANDNAAGLLAMGSMFSPELATLNVEPGGDPVPLNVPPFTDGLEAAQIAMGDGALGISVGESSASRLKDLLATEPADPPPFMSMTLDGPRYYEMMSDLGQMGNLPNADGSEREVSPELREAMTQVMTGVGDMIERISIDLTFTENGLEMPSRVTLAD